MSSKDVRAKHDRPVSERLVRPTAGSETDARRLPAERSSRHLGSGDDANDASWVREGQGSFLSWSEDETPDPAEELLLDPPVPEKPGRATEKVAALTVLRPPSEQPPTSVSRVDVILPRPPAPPARPGPPDRVATLADLERLERRITEEVTRAVHEALSRERAVLKEQRAQLARAAGQLEKRRQALDAERKLLAAQAAELEGERARFEAERARRRKGTSSGLQRIA